VPNNLTPGAAVPVPGTPVGGTSDATGATGTTSLPTLVTPPTVVTPPATSATPTDTSCLALNACFAQLDRDLCLFDDPSCANAFTVPASVDEPRECAQLLASAPSYAVIFAAGRSEYDVPADCRP
jgi:hypothetical protein